MAEGGYLSRSGNSCPLGKCTEPLKTLVPVEIKERFLAIAKFKGGESEYLRELVMRDVLGSFELVRLKVNAGSVSAGIGPVSDAEG